MTQAVSRRRRQIVATLALLLAACGGGGGEPAAQDLQTLDGNPPRVVAHRGASGVLPEATLEAYQKAIDLGADVLEADVIATADGALILRHDPNLAVSTDVASRVAYASRRRVDFPVDGQPQTGWFAHDFTLAEIRTLRAIATDPERPQQYNGRFPVITFEQLVALVQAHNALGGRQVAIHVETKNPTYHRDLGLPLEAPLLAAIRAAGWNSAAAPLAAMSFEPGSLKLLRSLGLKTPLVQLINASSHNLKTAGLNYAPPFDRPYEWTRAGDSRLFSVMVTPAGLAEIKSYADGIAPFKGYIVPLKGELDGSGQVIDVNGDGRIDLADATSQAPTRLVRDAHQAGLDVRAFTFRNESRRLAANFNGDPAQELLLFYRQGVDAVITDFSDTAVAARQRYLAELGR